VIENQLLPLLSARQLRSHFVMKVFQVNTLKEFEFFNSLFLKKLFPKNFAFCVLLQQKPNISNYILNSYLNQLKNFTSHRTNMLSVCLKNAVLLLISA